MSRRTSADSPTATATGPGVAQVVALPRWQRVSLYSVVTVLVASGVAWLTLTWIAVEPVSTALRSATIWTLRVHGVAAYATLVVVGSVLPVHLRLGWMRGRNRSSGVVLVTVLSLLASSGLWLYYGTDVGRDAASMAHWIVGLAMPVWLLLHRAWGLAARRRG